MTNELSKENFYLKKVFKCTDKKIKIFKSYLKNKLKINSYTLGEFSLKYDEKFQKKFLSSILKNHVISKKKKDKLFIINEIILNKDFFQDDFYFQYFLKNVLLMEDLLLRKLENNLTDDIFFKEKENNSITNWKECYSEIKKKLNEKGLDEKSKIFNNSILLFNSTKYSYEDKNCCDFFYGLKLWDIFFNYVSFDFLNYLLSNTLIFISDFLFDNSNKKFSLQNSFFIIVSQIELKYKDSKEIENKNFSKKKKLFYDTKQLQIIFQKKNIKESIDKTNKEEERNIKKDIIIKEEEGQNINVNARKGINEDEQKKKKNCIIKEDKIKYEVDKKININVKKDLSINKNKKHKCNIKESLIKYENDNKTNLCSYKILLNKRNIKKNLKETNMLRNCKKEKIIYSATDKKVKKKKHKRTIDKKYKYLLKKKKREYKINDSHTYVKLLYLLQCSGRILKNEVLKEIQEIQIEANELKKKNNESNVIKKKELKIKKKKYDDKEKKKIILPQIKFFYSDKKQNEEFYKDKKYNNKKYTNDKKGWNKIIINRNNILQHNTTNKYKNFLFNEHIIFDKIEKTSLFTYHLLNYIFKSDQKYFYHNNFIDEYKQKISKQIKCFTKKNDISSIISKKENILLDIEKKDKIQKHGIKKNDKHENIWSRLKKTKILKYVYTYFEEFINNVRNTKFQKVYNKFFPKKYTINRIAKIFKIIKLNIIKKYRIINIRKNRKFIKQKTYDFFFKNYDFLSFSFKTYKVINFMVYITKKCIPVKLLGRKHNFKVFLKNVKKFLLFHFKESFSMDQVMKNIKVKNIFQKEINKYKYHNTNEYSKELKNINRFQNVFKSIGNENNLNYIKYVKLNGKIHYYRNSTPFDKLKRQYFNKVKKINTSIQKRHLMNRLIYFLFNYFIMPIIRKFFFLTKSEQTVHKTIYFDRKLWNYFTKISNFSLYHQNFGSKKIKKKEENTSELKKKKKKGKKVIVNQRKKINKNIKKGVNNKKKIQKRKIKSIYNISKRNNKIKSEIFNQVNEVKRNQTNNKKNNEIKVLNNYSKQINDKLHKSIDNLYNMRVLNKKNVRPYLNKFYYKIRKKYFSLKKKYIIYRMKCKLKPKSKKEFINYINYATEKQHILNYISKYFFKNKKVNYIKRFIKLINRIKKKVNKKVLRKKIIKEKLCSSIILRKKLKKKKNIPNTHEEQNYFKNQKIVNKRKGIDKSNRNDKKKIYIYRMKCIIEKRNFSLKLNSINNFFSKKLRINWVPKKKGLRPLINLSTLNIPESVKHKILEILKNKKSSEFYLHNILNYLEKDKEKKKKKKKYNRKNFNPVSLNNICNFSLKCLGNIRHNKSSLFKNTITKTNEIEMKLQKWLNYIKNYLYRKKKTKKFIKNKLKNNKRIYAYICVGDFSNCYEHINHNYLFKILKSFFEGISNFEFIYLFKRSFRLFNKHLNNSLLSYYPVNVEKFGIHYINNLRDLIVKSNKNLMLNFLLKQLFKNKSMNDLYIFADSYKSVLVEKRDIFMTIITVIRYYYLNIYFSIKEIKYKKKNIFYFQIFKEEKKRYLYLSLRNSRKLEKIKKFNINQLEKDDSHESNNRINKKCDNDTLSKTKNCEVISSNIINDAYISESNNKNNVHIEKHMKREIYKQKHKELIKLEKNNGLNKISSEKHVLNFLDKKIISNINGLPQGFSLSNILCSLYYAYLDKNEEFQKLLYADNKNEKYSLKTDGVSKYLNLNSLLIRFIDDFLFITLNKKNIRKFKNLLLKKKIWGSNINSSKTKIFKFPLIYKNNLLINNTIRKHKKNKKVKLNTLKTKKMGGLKKKDNTDICYNRLNSLKYSISSNNLCKKNVNISDNRKLNNFNKDTLNNIKSKYINTYNCLHKIQNVKMKNIKKKKKKLTSFEIDRVIKLLKKKKKKNFKRKMLHNKKLKINKDIRRLKKLKNMIKNQRIGSVVSLEWLNNSYTFDLLNNSVHSTTYPWKNKSDATIRNHLHLNNIIVDKNNKNTFMKNLVENRIVRNIISKQKKYKTLYKNKQNIYFCYKKNFILLKTSILKFICSIKTLKHMFNAFYNSNYNTKFILYLISYMKRSLIKNRKLKFVKLFLIETAIESFQYANIYMSNNSLYPCLKLLKKIKNRLISKCKTRYKKYHLRQYHNLFNLIKRELFNSWPYMFKIKEINTHKSKICH
ncbi:telomerase reverse transcriptase, putative [Plasmodium gallinaceum]|uniref:Telomerase reverse transcriptase n=1 Tax=Plasmodium gallinaceum TaxID=5849 RepID=A0A1J1GY97_PLAGA|nr:telomerase reverse transcriptase, putative [Plasmodium gallinaceum]CRG97532.1 telomerase reverse transcriptase, putative [Plasmodium gallinaceum]